MDDIKDPSGKDPVFDTSVPKSDAHKEVGPESERRSGHEAEPEEEDGNLIDEL